MYKGLLQKVKVTKVIHYNLYITVVFEPYLACRRGGEEDKLLIPGSSYQSRSQQSSTYQPQRKQEFNAVLFLSTSAASA
jgi:hypothetical protein